MPRMHCKYSYIGERKTLGKEKYVLARRVENSKTLHHLSETKWFGNIRIFLCRHDNFRSKVYRLLFSQIVSDDFQNVPFCSAEQGLQDHTLLTAPMSTPPQSYLPSSHPLPSLLQFKICSTPAKFRFCWSQVRRETEPFEFSRTFRVFENPS